MSQPEEPFDAFEAEFHGVDTTELDLRAAIQAADNREAEALGIEPGIVTDFVVVYARRATDPDTHVTSTRVSFVPSDLEIPPYVLEGLISQGGQLIMDAIETETGIYHDL